MKWRVAFKGVLLNETFFESVRFRLQKFHIKVRTLGIKRNLRLGTLLRQYSDKLGITFDHAHMKKRKNRDGSNCQKLHLIEKKIHQFMLEIGKLFSLNVSLHDIPSFYKVLTYHKIKDEFRFSSPIFTFCQNSEIFEHHYFHCPSIWYDQKSKMITKNPYKDRDKHTCKGTNAQVAGNNLTSIMKVSGEKSMLSNTNE